MKKYHLTILGYYNNSVGYNSDTTRQTTVTCDEMMAYDAGYYEFRVRDESGVSKRVALYPIRNTIITNIETINKEQ